MDRHPSEAYSQLPPQGYYPIPSQLEKEINLRDYLKILRKRMWTIIAIFVIVLVTTTVRGLTVRPVYRGIATIQIDKETPRILDFRDMFAVSAWDTDYYQTHYQILASRQLAKRVINALDILEHPEFLPEPETPFQKLTSKILAPISHLKSSVLNLLYGLMGHFHKSPSKDTAENLSKDLPKDSPSEKDSGEIKKEAAVIGQFVRRVKIEPVRNTRLVRINFDSYYPELASEVANSIATDYIKLNLENRLNATELAKEQLSGQLDLMRAKVESADEILQAFCAKHGFLFLDDKEKNVTIQRLGDLSSALAKAEGERMVQEALYKHSKERDFDSLPGIGKNELIFNLKKNYQELEVQYSKLAGTFKSEYPEMVQLKKQMEAIQKRLNVEYNKFTSAIKSEYEFCLRKEFLVRSAFEQQKAIVTEMQQKTIQYSILKRESDTNKDLYRNLLQRMKEAGIQAGIAASNIQVVDQAAVPTHPYKPNIPQKVLMGAVIGLLLGVGLGFFLEYFDNTIKSPDDIEQIIQLPSFGMVPAFSYEKRRRMERGKIYPVELVAFGHPRSMQSEAYRNVRTSILLSFSERPPKSMIVSSSNPLEGKTTTAVNMAIAFSQTGSPILIIDGDMRRPKIHKIFEGSNGVGLSSFLTGNAELKSVIKTSAIPNLYYIPSGPIPPNPSELLGSNLFKNMMQFLGESFDQIIFDSPPILSFVDSLIISNRVDGVVLVALGGKTPREALHQSKNALLQVNAKILGVVVNRVDIGRTRYSYYNYGNYYHYEQEGKTRELSYRKSNKDRSKEKS